MDSFTGWQPAIFYGVSTVDERLNMPKNVKELREEIAAQTAKLTALSTLAAEEKREFTKEELSEIDALQGKGDKPGVIDDLNEQLERAVKLESITKEILRKTAPKQNDSAPKNVRVKPIVGKLKAFKGANAEQDAWLSGHYFAATLFGVESSRQWLGEHGYQIRNAHSTSDNSKGGYLVPQETASTIIRLVEEYGIFRQNVGTVFPVTSGSLAVPKRAGGFTVRHPGENQEISESDAQFSMVELTPHKAAILTRLSNELNEDSLPLLADFLTQEFAYAFAVDEDNAGFNGDGTQDYNRVVGLKNALAAGAVAQADGGQTSFGALTLASFNNAMAKVKAYPGAQNKWYIHSAGYYASMDRLKAAGGGNSMMDLSEGSDAMFLGYPVVFTQVLPSTLATNSDAKVAYFGDLSLACAMGDARSIEIASASERYFEYDQIGVRATERYDIQVHDRGTASEGAAVVCLQLA
jgi:HK97 family phage major capsid protein